MINPTPPQFEHVRGTQATARRMIISGAIGGPLYLGILAFLIARRDIVPFFIFAAILIGLWIYGIVRYLMPNLRVDGEFAMRVFGDRVECRCPIPHLAPTFNLAYESIHHLENEYHSEGPETWTIVTHSGERFTIPGEYDNPIEKVVRAMLTVRPDLLVEVYNSSGPTRVLVSSGGVRMN